MAKNRKVYKVYRVIEISFDIEADSPQDAREWADALGELNAHGYEIITPKETTDANLGYVVRATSYSPNGNPGDFANAWH